MHVYIRHGAHTFRFGAVVNRSPESSAAAAAALEIPNVAASWQELVSSPDIDAVCIGTWPYTHAEMTIAALNAGKHVLCEARMAMNAAQAKEMIAASAAHPELVAQIVPSPMTLKCVHAKAHSVFCPAPSRARARAHACVVSVPVSSFPSFSRRV